MLDMIVSIELRRWMFISMLLWSGISFCVCDLFSKFQVITIVVFQLQPSETHSSYRAMALYLWLMFTKNEAMSTCDCSLQVYSTKVDLFSNCFISIPVRNLKGYSYQQFILKCMIRGKNMFWLSHITLIISWSPSFILLHLLVACPAAEYSAIIAIHLWRCHLSLLLEDCDTTGSLNALDFYQVINSLPLFSAHCNLP